MLNARTITCDKLLGFLLDNTVDDDKDTLRSIIIYNSGNIVFLPTDCNVTRFIKDSDGDVLCRAGNIHFYQENDIKLKNNNKRCYDIDMAIDRIKKIWNDLTERD